MSARYQPIDQTLRRARVALRLNDALSAVATVAIALGAVLLLAFVLAVAGAPVTASRPWFLATAAVLLVGGLAVALKPLVTPWTDEAVARLIGDRHPTIGDSLLSAVQLHRDKQTLEDHFKLSGELIELHVDRTATQTDVVDTTTLPDRVRTIRVAGAAGAALMVWGALSLVFPGIAVRSRAFLFGSPPGSKSPVTAPEVAGIAPRLGDVTVTYEFPAYTGRETETLEGTDGSLKALKGTVAKIRLRADRPVKTAKIVLDGKDSIPVAVTASATGASVLEAEMTILENGSWTIEAVGTDGSSAANDATRTITVEEDQLPTAQIVWPADEDVEVNELEDVDVTWGAEDDFGLREAALVWENHTPPVEGETPASAAAAAKLKPKAGRIPLASFARENPLRHGDRMRWSLASLGLEPGGYIEYWVEVTDNDTISGPKKGRSAKSRLHLLSSAQIHEKAIALQEAVLKRMVHYLGDHLEIDPKTRARESIAGDAELLEGKARELAMAFDAVTAEMLKDPLGDEQVYRQVMEIRSDLVGIASSYGARVMESAARSGGEGGRAAAFARSHGDAVPVLEKDILFLDKLIEKQRFDGARQELTKLVQEQKDLKSLLEQYKKGGMKDSELAKALESKLAQLEQRMMEVAQKMASTMKAMPSDFDNSALQDDILEQIRKAIDEGRMDDAAALTEQMLKSLDEMVAQMDKIEDEFNMDPETAKRMQDAQKELAKLSDEQKKIVDDTNKLREQIQSRADQGGKKLDDFAKKEIEKVKKLREELDKLERQGVTDPWMRSIVRSARMGMERDLNGLEGGLKSGELGEALSHATDIDDTLQGIEQAGENMKAVAGGEGADPQTVDAAKRAQAKAKEIVDDLEKLRQSFEDSASSEEKQKLSELGKQQQKLQQRAQGLASELGEISESTPFLPGEAGQAVQGAAGSMGEASGKLKGGNAAGAVPSERQAQAQLGEAQQAMQGGEGQGKGQGPGMPLGQRMGGRNNRGQNGNGGFSTEKVEIPDGSQFRVPKEFREDILEAMKKPSPGGYEQLNQEYYERLIK